MMRCPQTKTRKLHYVANLFLASATIAFFLSLMEVSRDWLEINRESLETRFFPVVTDWTFRDWEQNDEDHWTAVVWVNKRRAECIYVADQVVTVTAITEQGPVEAAIRFIGDETPGNNRPTGWQRLDARLEIVSSKVDDGDPLKGQVLHRCHESTFPTVSPFGPVTVGVDMPWPDYVKRWIAAGRVGMPEEYESAF